MNESIIHQTTQPRGGVATIITSPDVMKSCLSTLKQLGVDVPETTEHIDWLVNRDSSGHYTTSLVARIDDDGTASCFFVWYTSLSVPITYRIMSSNPEYRIGDGRNAIPLTTNVISIVRRLAPPLLTPILRQPSLHIPALDPGVSLWISVKHPGLYFVPHNTDGLDVALDYIAGNDPSIVFPIDDSPLAKCDGCGYRHLIPDATNGNAKPSLQSIEAYFHTFRRYTRTANESILLGILALDQTEFIGYNSLPIVI